MQRLIRSQAVIKAEAREYFSAKQLAFISEVLPKLRLSAEERAWVEESRRHREQEAQAQAERQRAELAATKLRLRIVRGLLLLALLAALTAGYLGYKANKQEQIATEALDKYRKEQAAKAMLEIRSLRERGDRLYESGFFPSAKEMYEQARDLVQGQGYADFPDMQEKNRLLEEKINRCNQKLDPR